MSVELQIRSKGKFSSKKKIKRLQKCAEMGKKNKKLIKLDEEDITISKTAKNEDSTFPIKENRIVDFKHLSEKMFCSCCQSPLLIQNIKSEIKKGLASILYVFCENCIFLNKVTTGEQHLNPINGYKIFDVNTQVAIGALHAGCGATKTNKLFHTMNIPGMNPGTFKLYERIVGPIIEDIAKEAYAEAAILERIATVENIEELKKTL